MPRQSRNYFIGATKSDIFRLYGDFKITYLFSSLATNRNFRAIFTLRVCQLVSAQSTPLRLFLPICKFLHKITTHLATVDLPYQTKLEAGLALTHGIGLVVNRNAKIGRNVTLFHGVTIGQKDQILPSGERITGYPEIEDDVWIGPHAIIVGGITIGKGSRISGGALVTTSIPPYSLVMGNPSKVIKNPCLPDVVNPAPNSLLLELT